MLEICKQRKKFLSLFRLDHYTGVLRSNFIHEMADIQHRVVMESQRLFRDDFFFNSVSKIKKKLFYKRGESENVGIRFVIDSNSNKRTRYFNQTAQIKLLYFLPLNISLRLENIQCHLKSLRCKIPVQFFSAEIYKL